MNGKVARLKLVEGFGFIKPDDGSPDRFFFRTGLAPGVIFETLTEQQPVTFDHEDGKNGKGPRAVNVRPSALLADARRALG
jgi:CspA family cold shock protein